MEGFGLVGLLRMGHLQFRRVWGWLVVVMGLVVQSATVAAFEIVLLEVMGLSIGAAVYKYGAAKLTLNAVELVTDGEMVECVLGCWR